MSEKPCGYRHLTDKRLENEKFEVSVKCLFYLIGIRHLTYRSDGVTPDRQTIQQTYVLKLLAEASKFATHSLTHSQTPLLEPLAVQAPPGLKMS